MIDHRFLSTTVPGFIHRFRYTEISSSGIFVVRTRRCMDDGICSFFRLKSRIKIIRNEYTSEPTRISSLRPFSSRSCIPSIGELPVSLYSQSQEPSPPFFTFTLPSLALYTLLIAPTSFSGLLCGSWQRCAAQRSTMFSRFPPNVPYL